jgi:tRNA threonylcarbamoyladenosine biosynthesis protein TsaB
VLVDSSPVLAIDTATEWCSVALALGPAVHELSEQVGQKHSEQLLPMLDALLRVRGVALADCAAIAFGAGPGSFTGLRIACAVAQGLAWGAERPVLPIGNLEAIAWQAKAFVPSARRVAAVIDARMNEAYFAVVDVTGAVPLFLADPALAPAARLADALRDTAVDVLAGEGTEVFAAELATLDVAQRLPQLRGGAGVIATLAQFAYAQGRALPPEQAAPLYVRNHVALTIDERSARRAAAATAA